MVIALISSLGYTIKTVDRAGYYCLTEDKHEYFTCGEDLLIFSHVPAFLLPACPTDNHIVAGRRICLHLNVVDTQVALHPKPGSGDRGLW